MSNEHLQNIADQLGLQVSVLEGLAIDLFGNWLSGAVRYPSLSQQNQAWYAQVLKLAGKTNPTRDELKAWFGLPHGTAQYLASVFYDPSAEDTTALTGEIAQAVLEGIKKASDDKGKLGTNAVTAYLTPTQGKALENLLVKTLSKHAQEPPTITRMTGTVKVTFSRNQGLEPLCEALGSHGKDVRKAAGS